MSCFRVGYIVGEADGNQSIVGQNMWPFPLCLVTTPFSVDASGGRYAYLIVFRASGIRKEFHKTKGICGRHSSDSSSGNTQGIRNNHEDRTDCIFLPFNLPCRAQGIPNRSLLSFNVIFQNVI